MSTLNVSNITDGTTTVGTSYVVNGSAKAWANLNGTSTIAISDSFNVSSVADNGTGDYTHTLSSAMNNANYQVASSGTAIGAFHAVVGSDLPTTTALNMEHWNASNTLSDNPRAYFLINGDLA